ncbi:MAG: MurR/RpiR family transcriptional regulator [Lawsonibacter sp.]|nr:MurR/RpiR family transcriptional regulator [Lawsonibacter sp.]
MSHNVFETISSQYFQLTNSEKKVADYILGHRIDVQYMSISELAEECAVADATISRFCRRLGISGYNAFKLELAKASTQSAAPVSVDGLDRGDSCAQSCKRALGESVAALEQTVHLLDPGQVRRALELIQGAGRVVCMGQGGCMVIAQEAWSMFSTVSPKFQFVPDSHLQISTAAVMSPKDVVLYFSFSGSTRDLQDLLEVAREKKVKVILISRFPKSPGGQMADVVLQCGANEGPLQAGSATARMAQLFVLEVLFLELCRSSPAQVEKYQESIAEAVAKKHL